MLKNCIVCLIFFGIAALVHGQEQRAAASTSINGKSVTIEYGSPALKGRNPAELMQKLPADRIWRAGAGAVTTLATEADLAIGEKKVPAGKYSLYMHCPEDGSFSLVINRDLGVPLVEIFPQAPPERAKDPYPHFFNYTEDIGDKELTRVPLKQIDSEMTESLTYGFTPAGQATLLTISWGKQAWTVELKAAD
jgi:hypothetical protein